MQRSRTWPETAHVTDEGSLKSFLDQLESELEQMGQQLGELSFTQYQTKQRPAGMDELEAEQASVYRNEAYAEIVGNWVGRVEEPLLARRLEVWNRTLRGARVSAHEGVRKLVNEISDALVKAEYLVQGEELNLGAVRSLLRSEPDRERRKAAWSAFAPLSEQLAPKTREMMKLRNALAQEQGFPTYAHMQLDAQGLGLEQVQTILEELALRSNESYSRTLQRAAEQAGLSGEVQPWDIKYLLDGTGGPPRHYFKREHILERLREWGRDHGCDIDALGISVHFMDIPYNGLCMGIKKGDIRILGNPADGHNYYKTSFHELGHALHGAFNNPGAWILRREPSVFSEGMAEMLGYTVNEPAWLAHMGLSEAEIAAASQQVLGPWFAYLRQRSAHALLEYAAYQDPDQDLDTLNAQIESRLLGCALDTTPRWAGEPNAWYSRFPVYWQNYVLADVIASQVHHHLKQTFGSFWRNREAIAYVKEQYWAPGGRIDWQEKLLAGTGQPLGTAALVADLN